MEEDQWEEDFSVSKIIKHTRIKDRNYRKITTGIQLQQIPHFTRNTINPQPL